MENVYSRMLKFQHNKGLLEELKGRHISHKQHLRQFFEGVVDYNGIRIMSPVVDISISKLGITNFEFNEHEGSTEMVITLERPGILIGKAGETIDKLQEHLSGSYERPVTISVIESKLWR